MVQIIYVPIRKLVEHRPMTENEKDQFLKEQRTRLRKESNARTRELDLLLIKGYELIAWDSIDLDNTIYLVFMLYLSPENVKVPF